MIGNIVISQLSVLLQPRKLTFVVIRVISSDVDECVNNAGMKKDVCTNGQCQNTMKDYMCVCNAGFRGDVTKKLCNGEKHKHKHVLKF